MHFNAMSSSNVINWQKILVDIAYELSFIQRQAINSPSQELLSVGFMSLLSIWCSTDKALHWSHKERDGTEYCPGELWIPLSKAVLGNFPGMASTVNRVNFNKTEPVFTGFWHGKLSYF